MKLRTKIQLFSSVFMLVLILLVNTSVYYFFYKLSVDGELRQLNTQAETIISSVNDNPTIAKGQLLRAYLPTDGMIRVIDQKGNVLNTVTRESEYKSLPIHFSNKEIHDVVGREKQADAAVIAQPIIWNNGKIVTLQVSKHLTDLQTTMQTLLFVVIGASIVMLIPMIIAGRVLSGFLLKPIQALIHTMNANKQEGDWEKIPIRSHSKDELYQMEQTFNEMIDHLRESFNKQEQFVSDASHELKTPIAIVKSYAQLLDRRGLVRPEIFKESIEAIDTEADRMQKLVEQLLLLAKSKNEAVLSRLNIVRLCEDIVAVFTGAYDRTIELKTKDDPIFVQGNMEQLKQVIYSLLDNALKYSDDKVELTISVEQNNVYLAIQDFGPGIPDSEQAKVFDRFYRVDKARNRELGGTGLGLAIAKSIVEGHNGKLFVSSTINVGTVFTVELPVMKNN